MSKVSERASNPIINLIIDIASLNYFLDHGTKNSVICFFCRFSGAFSSTVWQSFAAFPRTYANKRDLCASGSSGRFTARGNGVETGGWRSTVQSEKGSARRKFASTVLNICVNVILLNNTTAFTRTVHRPGSVPGTR